MLNIFKKLSNKLMPNEEIKTDVISEENKGAIDPQASTPISENSVPGVEVPAGHQVPGTDMSTGKPVQSDIKSPEDQGDKISS